MISKKNITGIILAGGKSSRMKTDKAAMLFNGITFLETVANAMLPLVCRILVISNHANHDSFNLERVNDIFPDCGPLGGLYTGLYHSQTEYNLVLSCDMPTITTEVLNKLIMNSDAEFDVIQFKASSQTMPLIALYKTSSKTVFFELLKKRRLRLQTALNHLNVKTILLEETDWKYVVNVNTEEELKTITAL